MELHTRVLGVPRKWRSAPQVTVYHATYALTIHHQCVREHHIHDQWGHSCSPPKLHCIHIQYTQCVSISVELADLMS